MSTSRSSADTIDQHSTGDNKSNVDGETGGNDATSTSTAEIAHFAEQLDSISDDEEGGEGGGETLNSITGGLQVRSTIFYIIIGLNYFHDIISNSIYILIYHTLTSNNR